MRRIATIGIAVLVAALLMTSLATANTPSAKVTAKVGSIAILDKTDMGWTTIMHNTLKTPNQKDVFVDASLECGLYTQTLVKSSTGTKDTSTAEAGVMVQVLVDGQPALPGPVEFCRRSQELTAKFGGILERCTDLNGDGTITADECTWTNEELNLVLKTMNANSFNFVLDDLGAGNHTIEVQAKIDSATSAQAGSAEAKATIGKGSVTVEEVRMVQNEDIELP